MAGETKKADALGAWRSIARDIETAIDGLAEDELDLRGGSEGWSIRETAHHLVESDLVIGTAIIAAVARSGSIYDWSWVSPDLDWMQQAGYSTAPVRPALLALKALSEHVAGLVSARPDGYLREVQLLDAPGSKPYTRTVRDLLVQQVEHSREHLRVVAQIRAGHGR